MATSKTPPAGRTAKTAAPSKPDANDSTATLDPFAMAIANLKSGSISRETFWSEERKFCERHLDEINELRTTKNVTLNAFCESVKEAGGPKLDSQKLQAALYYVNSRRNPEMIKHFSNEAGKGKRPPGAPVAAKRPPAVANAIERPKKKAAAKKVRKRKSA